MRRTTLGVALALLALGCDDGSSTPVGEPPADGSLAPLDGAREGGVGPPDGGPAPDAQPTDAQPTDAQPTDAQPTDAQRPDAEAPPPNVAALPLAQAGLCAGAGRREGPAAGPFTAAREPSPFGVGLSTGAALGPLADPGAIRRAPNPNVVRYDLDLGVETFDVYVPESYDGSAPFGLVTFVQSGDDGRFPARWLPVLDEARLIGIAGDGIGNRENVDRRLGLAVLGAYRALELFHIDRGRVFASGNSGGGRAGMVAALLHPELFAGAVPLCGGSWHQQVEQAYETREPDGHYEHWGDVFYPAVDGQPFGAWLAGYGQRFALMTSFDDFREGDLLNIYHFGLEAEGFEGRLLEVAGGHCATTADQLREALAFVEHPHLDGLRSGFVDASAPGASAAAVAPGLRLVAGPTAAVALGRDRVHWQTPGGLVLRWTLDPDEGFEGPLTVGLYDRPPGGDGIPAGALVDDPDRAAIQVAVTAAGLRVEVRGFGDEPWTAFEAPFADWDGASPLALKVHLWGNELRVESGAHLERPGPGAPGVRLLDDARSVRIRWPEVEGRAWPDGAWAAADGAHLAAHLAGGAATLSGLALYDATGLRCGE